MALRDLFFGTSDTALVEVVEPRRTFADVVLPPATLRALNHALVQIRKHDLLFGEWGLGERHDTGLGLAFNFAGPPGTGKTICAEAVASTLGRRLLVVRYAELESQWAGATAKNVAAVFHAAAEQDAVLLFDEADAVAGRRFTSMDQGYQREANAVVNVLLRELERFSGVVIFATNLAANFDPAFERRIRTHILFEMPGPEERERIWRAQIHDRRTPLAEDVDFAELAEEYPVSGGDIKNAVLKAAQMAIAEPGPDHGKRISQRHFREAMDEVLVGRRVMDQSLFGEGEGPTGLPAPFGGVPLPAAADEMAALEEAVGDLAGRLAGTEDALETLAEVPETLRRLDDARDDAVRRADELLASLQTARDEARASLAAAEAEMRRRMRPLALLGGGALLLAAAALAVALL